MGDIDTDTLGADTVKKLNIFGSWHVSTCFRLDEQLFHTENVDFGSKHLPMEFDVVTVVTHNCESSAKDWFQNWQFSILTNFDWV